MHLVALWLHARIEGIGGGAVLGWQVLAANTNLQQGWRMDYRQVFL
jgi:hypothetical protein